MKSRRVVIFTVLMALLLIGGGLVGGNTVKHRLQSNLVNNYGTQEETLGNQIASTLQGRVQKVQIGLQALALDADIQSGTAQACANKLTQAVAIPNMNANNLGRVNASGVFSCSLNPALLGVPASKLGTYVPALIADPAHNPVMSHMITVPGVKGYAVAVHVPVYDANHRFTGTVGGAIYLNQLASTYLDTIKFAKTGYASLQDDNGDIVYSHTKSRIGTNYFSPALQKSGDLHDLNVAVLAARQGRTSIVSYTNSLGIKKLASVVPVTMVQGHRWIVIVNVPVSEISAAYITTGLNSAFSVLALIFILAVLVIAILMVLNTLHDGRLKQAEDQFISLVSHQLRTPLTAIRLFSEMMATGQAGKLTPKQDDYVDKIHISTIRMIRLVGDILNVSRIELNRLKVEPEEVDANKLISTYIDEVLPLAEEKHIPIEFHELKGAAHLKLDQTLFGQVVHNLLTNAVRYSKEGGTVRVQLTKTEKAYELSVADSGIGIPKEARKHIFTRFYRARNAVETVGDGTGLGLYLIKMILEQSGGAIRFESRLGHGTTFYVTIPADGMRAKGGDKRLERA
jgi:signal transduction histidine kinase